MTRSPFSRLTASFASPAFFVLTVLAAIALLGFGMKRAQATVYYVTTTGTGNGSTWAMAGPLQTVIAAAHSGDQVWVKYGTYTGNFTATDGVAVYGHFAGTETSLSQRQLTNTAYTTILDGNKSGTVYTVPSPATGTNTLDGFTVENGTGTNVNGNLYGGGLYNISTSDALDVSNCTFSGNTAIDSVNSYGGGGIYAASLTTSITSSTFLNNDAYRGGGIHIFGSGTSTITGCTFTNNSATGSGGAISIEVSTVTVNDCLFSGNTSENGSGIDIANSVHGTAIVSDCSFVSTPTTAFNAIYLYNNGSTSASLLVKDNLIVGAGPSTSKPGGIFVDTGNSANTSYVTIADNTIVNTSDGINIGCNSGAIAVANNILYGNAAGLVDDTGVSFTSSHNDVYGNTSYSYQGVSLSSSDLQVNPMFVDASTGDYQLEDTSPLINTGDDSYVLSGDKDLLGNPRIESTAVDIGAYEYTLIPTITSFTPTSGSVGTVVTVTGTNLENLVSVRFHNANAKTFSVNGAGTQVTVTVPSGAGTGTFTVTTIGGTVTTKTPFTVTVAVKSLAFSPTTIAPGGSSAGTVTLTSPAPTGGAVVAITEGAFAFQVATVTIAAGQTTGTFTATATASAPAGAYPFTATYNNSSKSATLTVN